MAYQRGSLKRVERKEGLSWVLRYRSNGKEQTPLIVGLVSDFPSEDEANVEVDRLGFRIRINCTNPKTNRAKFIEKWRGVLAAEQFANGERVFLARDRSRHRKHILVIDHCLSQPDRDTGSQTPSCSIISAKITTMSCASSTRHWLTRSRSTWVNHLCNCSL